MTVETVGYVDRNGATVTASTTIADTDRYALTPPVRLTPAALVEYRRRAALDPDVPTNSGGGSNSGLLDPAALFHDNMTRVDIPAGAVLVNERFHAGVRFLGTAELWNCDHVADTAFTYDMISGSSANGLSGSLIVGNRVKGAGLAGSNKTNAITLGHARLLFNDLSGTIDVLSAIYPTTMAQPTRSYLNWMHDNVTLPDSTASGGFTHSDLWQLQRGKNWESHGDRFDRAQMQAFMIKQEVSSSLADMIDAILIRNAHIGGSKTGFNLSVSLGNQLAGVTIDRPVFDLDMKPASPGLQPYAIIANLTAGSSNQFLGKILNPTYADGTPVTIKQGA